jgi:cysteine desulfurase
MLRSGDTAITPGPSPSGAARAVSDRAETVRIYLDHNATTPVAADVVRAMSRALEETFGNPSSIHAFGQQARAVLDAARASVAALLGADSGDIVFTSGGTEADNLAVRGAAETGRARGRTHLVTSGIEHEAVLNTVRALARAGWSVTVVPVDASGVVSPGRLEEAMRPETALVSVMHANNEVGTLQPVRDLAAIAHAHGAVFHTDAVQSAGKVPVRVGDLGVDLLAVSAHKLYGPKGVGALWIKRGTHLAPPSTGGRQERNRRPGTENVPAIAGFGVAAERARAALDEEGRRLAALRDRFEAGVLDRVPRAHVNGARDRRVPNTTNISFEHVEAESLLIALDLDGIAVSTGSACSSGTLEPSHVLRAMGLPAGRAESAIRFSFGAGNTDADVDRVLEVLPRAVENLRRLARRSISGRASG